MTALEKVNPAFGMPPDPRVGADGIPPAAGPGKPSPAPRQFPVMKPEAYHGLVGEIVRTIEPHTESDSVALLLTLHAFFGNAIGRGPHYRVEGDEHGPNLFALLIGDSSKARKGTSAGRVKQIFRRVDERWTAHCIHTGLSSGEGVIWAVRDAIVKTGKDGTDEELDSGTSDKRLLVLESEFSGALRVMQREGNILSRVLRDAWDRGDLASMTKNSPARATGAWISILAHITSAELRECLDKTEMANGFANRFLFAAVRRSKFLPFGGDLSDETVAAMGGRIAEAIERAKDLTSLSMTAATRAVWADVYPRLSGGSPGLLGALTARAEAQVIRLSLLYALWDEKAQIEPGHLVAAMAVVEFCGESVRYVFGDTLGDTVADAILSGLRDAGPKGLTRTEITNLFSRNQSAAQIARALEELERHSLAMQKGRREGSSAGRPAEVWVLQ